MEKMAVDHFINKEYSDDTSSCPDEESNAKSKRKISVTDARYQREVPSPSRRFEKQSTASPRVRIKVSSRPQMS
jgi:hypothetical protein